MPIVIPERVWNSEYLIVGRILTVQTTYEGVEFTGSMTHAEKKKKNVY